MAILTELPEEHEAEITYDVFLSFREKDTRLGFMDHLYQALVDENISTFLDDQEEVETGEELKPELTRAIKSCRVSIIVLSKNYASSTWCLDELVMILEQRRVSDHFVLPVFYNVEATHIRKQESTFGEELLKHKQRIESEKDAEKKIQGARKLEMWRKGLTEIADLKGKDATGRRETVFIEELVKEISSRLELHTRTKIPHLIGMDMSILSISSWLKGGSSKSAEILTIWGMAGIGKTTLAKYIYRLHCHEFERSSFVEEIERKCAEQTYVLLDLQKQLLGDILRKRMIEEHDVDACTSKIEKALFNKPTLVVLDGVDNSEQVDVLIGTKGFHPGSKIILTTKDGPLTEKSAIFGIKVPPKHTKHELYGLSATESLRLLCWHAFGQYDPKEGYEEEAIRASKFCGGHPLALKVLGSSLNNEDVATWSDTFEMLETGEFHAHVHKVLQISFDSLPSESCKELFKHIACFFVGKDREVTETILKECGIRTSYGIKKLIDRCLLMIGGRNELRMHQLLQEMGRDLVRKESPEKPWKRSRVWNHGESLNLLKEDKGTGKIQGLVLDMKMLEKEPLRGLSVAGHELEDNDPNMIFGIGPSNHSILKFPSSGCKKIELRTNALRKMDKLNLLQLNHVKLKGSYKNFPEGLRGLCMHGFQLKYVPSDLPMENLVALDMSYSNLTQLWKKPKILVSLKILNLSYCKFVRIGGFPGLPALERLILVGCERLTEVCESIGGCDELAFLDMSYCKELQKIPSSIGKLKKLKVLSINGCIGASAFSSEMKVLNADDISMKTDNSFSSLTNCIPASSKSLLLSLAPSLLSLSLKNNNLRTESFPKDFSSLSKLKELYLDGNPIDSLPDCVRSLIRLDKLSLTGCSKLTSVCCPIISTLRDLRVDDCQSLVKVTFHPGKPPYSCNYLMSDSVTEVEGKIKIQDLAQIDEKILCSLGWTNLQHVKCLDLTIWNSDSWISAKKLPIQMYFEFGIFSTCFPGEELPNWFGNRSPGSSLSFTIPSSPVNKSLQGLNIGFVHMFPGTGRVSVLGIKVRNVTKNRSWTYYGVVFAIQTENGGLVWLSHWMFANNELEAGDEVSINIIDDEEEDVEQDGVIVTECAISPVYTTGDKEEDPLGYYKSWKVMVGEYVPCFEFTIGNYLITRRIKYIYPRGEHGHRWRGIKPMHRARYRYGVLR